MMLELKNICSGYLEGVDVVHNINLSLEEGSATAILGLNGAGKTTLCQSIMNMNPHRRGEVWFDGKNVSDLQTGELSNLGISFFMSHENTFPELSVWENMQIAAGEMNDKRIDEVRQIFPILSGSKSGLKRKMADKLSGGERNQLAVAMCLLSNARLLILDEPSSGLSPTAIKAMYKILDNIINKQNKTVLIIEQNEAIANDLCSKNHIVENGGIKNIL